MIGNKRNSEVIRLFEIYRKRHPQRVCLSRFLLFAGVGSDLKDEAKRKCRKQVDALIEAQAENLGVERQEFVKHGAIQEVYYWPKGRQQLFEPQQTPLKVTRDPRLATWTADEFKASKAKHREEQDAAWMTARKAESEAERAAVKNLKVKKEVS
jgi:hypothetical protein